MSRKKRLDRIHFLPSHFIILEPVLNSKPHLADYGYKGFVFLLIMYWLHQQKPAQAVIGSCWLIYEWKACFAFIPLNMYNEKRGFIQGKWVKYLFYAFYPVHIAILTVIRKMWFGI